MAATIEAAAMRPHRNHGLPTIDFWIAAPSPGVIVDERLLDLPYDT